MSTATRIPPLLAPYVCVPPRGSLVLLTSVLGASTNWLVLRFLYSALASPHPPASPSGDKGDGGDDGGYTVVMVSFLRDRAFWVEGMRRMGVGSAERWVFLDGLAGRVRAREVVEVVKRVKGRVVVVLDGVDWLAVSGDGMGDVEESVGEIMELDVRLSTSSHPGFLDLTRRLTQHVHTTILTLSSPPLSSHQASHRSPLESAHFSLLTSLAHRVNYIMSVRLLETGVARDVSGILRVTLGPGDGGGGSEVEVEEGEMMFWVGGGGGGVRVWEKGGLRD